jgi:LPS sulfotransferase NodH
MRSSKHRPAHDSGPGRTAEPAAELRKLFERMAADERRLRDIEGLPDPTRRYIIAMTPRSGSSYLCDLLKGTRRLGRPHEALNRQFLPGLLRKVPGRTPEEYLRNVLKVRATRNGVSGLKASWFQFENFSAALGRLDCLDGLHYIYLTRRDLAAQAVSLYKATASSVFHSNVAHDEEALTRLASLDYSYQAIKEWYEHIARQEEGWQRFFLKNRIFPLYITHEDIAGNVLAVMRRIAAFIGIAPRQIEMPETPSVFAKIGDATNLEWARRFEWEKDLGSVPPPSASAAFPKRERRSAGRQG